MALHDEWPEEAAHIVLNEEARAKGRADAEAEILRELEERAQQEHLEYEQFKKTRCAVGWWAVVGCYARVHVRESGRERMSTALAPPLTTASTATTTTRLVEEEALQSKIEERGRIATEHARAEATRVVEEKAAARRAAEKARSRRPKSAGSIGNRIPGGAKKRGQSPNPRTFSGIKIDAPLFGGDRRSASRRGSREGNSSNQSEGVEMGNGGNSDIQRDQDGGGYESGYVDQHDEAAAPNRQASELEEHYLSMADLATHAESEGLRMRQLADQAWAAAAAAAQSSTEAESKLATCETEATEVAAEAEAARANSAACRFDVLEHNKSGVMVPGTYRIITTRHEQGQQVAGWGLAAWNGLDDTKRNDWSTWVCVHAGDDWPCDWLVEPGTQEGTWRIKTCGHDGGKQPAGWGLAAWHGQDDARRNDYSTWAAVHAGDEWPMDWTITPGQKPTTWRILTTHHEPGKQPSDWGLSAWHAHGGERNNWSSKVAVHSGDHWPMDWVFTRVVTDADRTAAQLATTAAEEAEAKQVAVAATLAAAKLAAAAATAASKDATETAKAAEAVAVEGAHTAEVAAAAAAEAAAVAKTAAATTVATTSEAGANGFGGGGDPGTAGSEDGGLALSERLKAARQYASNTVEQRPKSRGNSRGKGRGAGNGGSGNSSGRRPKSAGAAGGSRGRTSANGSGYYEVDASLPPSVDIMTLTAAELKLLKQSPLAIHWGREIDARESDRTYKYHVARMADTYRGRSGIDNRTPRVMRNPPDWYHRQGRGRHDFKVDGDVITPLRKKSPEKVRARVTH